MAERRRGEQFCCGALRTESASDVGVKGAMHRRTRDGSYRGEQRPRGRACRCLHRGLNEATLQIWRSGRVDRSTLRRGSIRTVSPPSEVVEKSHGRSGLAVLACTSGERPSADRFVGPIVDRRDLLNEALTGRMIEIEQVIKRPMKVVCHVRDLLIQTVSRVRQNPPEAPPATSTVKVCSHDGHCTFACVWPS